MYDFNFQSASGIDDAAARLSAAEDGTVMAGGQTLIPVLKQRLAKPSDVISLAGAGLSGITNNGDSVAIGAMTTHAEVAASTDVPAVLRSVAEGIGDAQVRNRGTLGGSLANNDPAADYPAAALGLGATITTNQRDIAADDFVTGMFETALNDGEIIKSVTFPNATKAAYAKFPNPASRYALVGVFVAQAADGVRVAVTGATDHAHRGPRLEKALSDNWSPDALDGVTLPVEGMNSDIHGSAEYRAHLVIVMAKRAVAAAG
ncbi:MAG: FAD binding domain-containing protein [Alphaproteobacteria bacterium]